jgi:GT2 family glycosyltransferase
VSAPPTIAVIILNWNGLSDTLACLNSLRRTEVPNLRLVVWDNGSSEDLTPLQDAADLLLLRSDENVGFAAGCNGAARRALADGADYLLFLNNDTVVPPDMIPVMLRAQATANAGLVGVPEVLRDRPDAPRRLGARWLPLSCRVDWCYAPAIDLPRGNLRLDVLSGCALLMSRQLVDEVGLFDEVFFAYWEDADLCLRVRRAGYHNLCATDTHVIHKSGATTGRRPGFNLAQLYLVCRGQALMARKHARGAGRVLVPLRLVLSAMASALRGFISPAARKPALAKLSGFLEGWHRKPVDKTWLS